MSPASFAVCEIDLDVADTLAFDKTAIEVERSCGEVILNLTHSGKLPRNTMGHNWVLSSATDLAGIAQDGQTAGLEKDCVKPGDSRVLAHTNVIGGGESTSVTFSLDDMAESEYTYFCSFPGHWVVMKGVLTIR